MEKVEAIPKDVAQRLCEEIREDNRGKWYRWTPLFVTLVHRWGRYE